MEYIKRDIEKAILEASKYYSAVLVTGPRQIGKTTTLRHIMGDARNYITLDDLEARKMAQSDPELFLSIYPAPILIDEIQSHRSCSLILKLPLIMVRHQVLSG